MNKEALPLYLMRLCDAARYIQRQHPDWNGDITDCVGITMYSLAFWWRKRALWQEKAHSVACLFMMGDGNCYTEIRSENGTVLCVLNGLAWGYGGEGPHGLAYVLCDIFPEKFPNVEAALREVASHPMESSWVIEKGDR